MDITKRDTEIVRELAKRQADIANTPEMLAREALWREHNACRTRTPIVTAELGTFMREFEHLYKPQCETEAGRQLEWYFFSNRIEHDYLCDDHVMPREFAVGVWAWLQPFGIEVKTVERNERTFAYKLDHPVGDLQADWDKFKKSPFGCNLDGTKQYFKDVGELFGDILPPRLYYTPYLGLANNIFQIMGMENMMIAMCDYPELFHEMMQRLTDDYTEMFDMVERDGCVFPNNFYVGVPQGTYGVTDELPRAKSAPYTLGDVWGYMDSQETSSISPEMYHEFFHPYYKRIGERFGLLDYGCCEGVHALWDKSLSEYTNLRKVSVSPWCDEEYIGGKLRGRKTIYHRKPFPNFMNAKELDEAAFTEHIDKTLRAARGCFLEFSYRDVYSLGGDPHRIERAVKIIKARIGEVFE